MIKVALQKILSSANGNMLLDVNFEIKKGEFITLFGDSGAGKTSILRMIAGLFDAEKGYISVNDSIWLDTVNNINLKTQQRKIGFLFQDYALFPNMTVRENLSYALEKGQNVQIIEELIELIELGDLQNIKPNKLSGGQKQRVALARSLVRMPEILMLDEPLSALDTKIRSKLQNYILKVHKKYNLTTILISHEISEVIKLSQKVFIIENGKIINIDTPINLFTNIQDNDNLKLIGEVVKININSIEVLIGKNYIKLPMSKEKIKNITIGDFISIPK